MLSIDYIKRGASSCMHYLTIENSLNDTFILTLDPSKVTYVVRMPDNWHFIFSHHKKGRTLMGAILDVVEMLKEPVGMVIAVVVIAVGYFFVKWVFQEPENEE